MILIKCVLWNKKKLALFDAGGYGFDWLWECPEWDSWVFLNLFSSHIYDDLNHGSSYRVRHHNVSPSFVHNPNKCCSKGVSYGFQTMSSNLSMITIPLCQGVILYLMDALYKDQEGCSQWLGNMDWWVRIEVYTFFAYLVTIILVMIKSRFTHVGVVQNQNITHLQIAIFFEYLCT